MSRYSSHFPRREKVRRALWNLARALLFRPSPRRAFGWRRALLRLFGAGMGHNSNVYADAQVWAPWNLEMGDYACLGPGVDCYSMARISIGAHATVSQNAFLCCGSHDITDPHMRLITAPIAIGAGAWVCARAVVGPGVTLGEGAVVGAASAVFKDVEPWAVVGGNPARVLKKRVLRPQSQARESGEEADAGARL